MENKMLKIILILQAITLVVLGSWFLSGSNRDRSFQQTIDEYKKLQSRYQEQFDVCKSQQSQCQEQLEKYRQQEEENKKQLEEYNRNLEFNK